MAKILALDISTKTGWAVLEKGDPPVLLDHGRLVSEPVGTDVYPWSLHGRAKHLAEALVQVVLKAVSDHGIEAVVIEETNLGRNRYSQKTLEFIHALFLNRIRPYFTQIFYLNTSAWRKQLGQRLTAEDRRQNQRLSRAKSAAKRAGRALDRKALGIRGRTGLKHVSVRWANETFGLSLKMKDNDIADAISLAAAYLSGAPVCDGK